MLADYDIGHQATVHKTILLPSVDLSQLTEDEELFVSDFDVPAPADDFPWKNLVQLLKTSIGGNNRIGFTFELSGGTKFEEPPQ